MYSDDIDVNSPSEDSSATNTDFAAGLISAKEQRSEVPLKVQGRLPPYLKGSLYRVGPGIFDVYHCDGKRADMKHWFDGIGVVFKFSLDPSSNTVTYMCRSTCPELIRAIESTPKSEYKTMAFGTLAHVESTRSELLRGLHRLARPFTKDPETGVVPLNLNVSLEKIPGHGELLVRSDMSAARFLDPATLEPGGPFAFSDVDRALTGIMSAAHSAVDANTGDLFNAVSGDMFNPGRVSVFCVKPDGRSELLADYYHSSTWCYLHSVSITDRYVIVELAPWRMRWRSFVASGACAFAPYLHLDDARSTVFVVVSREKRRVVGRFEADAVCNLHHINAFDGVDGDTAFIDVCRYDNATVFNDFYLDHLRTKRASWFSRAVPCRYVLSGLSDASKGPRTVVHGRATWHALYDQHLEMPCVAAASVGRPYRFVYGVSQDELDEVPFASLKKVDLRTGAARTWKAARCMVSEPTFVSDPQGTAEDDGVVMSVVVDAASQKSFMLVLDAHTMEELCRAEGPHIIPHSFHGVFVGRK